MNGRRKRLDKRIVIFSLWIFVATVLLVVFSSKLFETSREEGRSTASNVEAVVQRLFREYGINEKSIRTRRVTAGQKDFVRIERRISVSPGFNALSFNHDLSRLLAGEGATVIGTEISEDKTVTLHIKVNELIVQSLVFVTME